VLHSLCLLFPAATAAAAEQHVCSRLLLLQVVLYHGAKRGSISPEELAAADVVLTTYSTIENDFRRTMMPAKVPCT
jgi:hypothetical protein